MLRAVVCSICAHFVKWSLIEADLKLQRLLITKHQVNLHICRQTESQETDRNVISEKFKM